MTGQVVRIRPEEPVGVAARMLAQYNIGALPVCGYDGSLKGLVTDRDIVTRCLAAGRDPAKTQVSQVMTRPGGDGKAGYGGQSGLPPHGPGAGPAAAHCGKRQALRYGEPGGPGRAGGNRH